jgi:predicted P-loop ATPase/GTPase
MPPDPLYYYIRHHTKLLNFVWPTTICHLSTISINSMDCMVFLCVTLAPMHQLFKQWDKKRYQWQHNDISNIVFSYQAIIVIIKPQVCDKEYYRNAYPCTEMLIHVFVTVKLIDNCKCTAAWLSYKYQIRKLQNVLNSAARLLDGSQNSWRILRLF